MVLNDLYIILNRSNAWEFIKIFNVVFADNDDIHQRTVELKYTNRDDFPQLYVKKCSSK